VKYEKAIIERKFIRQRDKTVKSPVRSARKNKLFFLPENIAISRIIFLYDNTLRYYYY